MKEEGFDQRFTRFSELKRDGNSVVGWAEDVSGIGLVRRLVKSRRLDSDTRAGLLAEAEYLRRLECERGPAGQTLELGDELVLEYSTGPGVELDRLLMALERANRLLTPSAALALISELIHNADAIANLRPLGLEGRWGHGEISPRSVVLGLDGFARLYEARLLASGYRAAATSGSTFCRAPELTGGTLVGTPEGDVYSIGALLSLILLGTELLQETAEPLALSVARALAAAGEVVPAQLAQVILRAVALEPRERFVDAEGLRAGLKDAWPFDLDEWRGALLGLAAFADELAEDPIRVELSPAVLSRFQGLLRAIRPEDELEGGRRRTSGLPRRITVVPRRPSSAREGLGEDSADLPPTGSLPTPPAAAAPALPATSTPAAPAAPTRPASVAPRLPSSAPIELAPMPAVSMPSPAARAASAVPMPPPPSPLASTALVPPPAPAAAIAPPAQPATTALLPPRPAPEAPPALAPAPAPSQPPTDRAPRFLLAEGPAIQGLPLSANPPPRDTLPPAPVRDTIPPGMVPRPPRAPAEKGLDLELALIAGVFTLCAALAFYLFVR